MSADSVKVNFEVRSWNFVVRLVSVKARPRYVPVTLPMAPHTSPKETFMSDRSITLAPMKISSSRGSAPVLSRSVVVTT